jgi:hypothetical protein
MGREMFLPEWNLATREQAAILPSLVSALVENRVSAKEAVS